LITSYLRWVTKRSLPQDLASVTSFPSETIVRDSNRQAMATRNGTWQVRGTVMTLTEMFRTSRKLQYRILDASATRDKRSGGAVVYVVATWLVVLVLLLAWGIAESAGVGLLSW